MQRAIGSSIGLPAFILLLASVEAAAASKVVAVGDNSPIGGTFSAAGGDSPFLLGTNDKGDVLFWSGVSGGANDWGVFLFSNGTFTKIVAENDPSPLGGTFVNVVGSTASYRLNRQGDVAFVSQIMGGSADVGVFLFSGGSIVKVAANGDQAPAPFLIDPIDQPDVYVGGFILDFNDGGQIAFSGLQGKWNGIAWISRGGIYLSSGGAPATRAIASGIDTEAGRLNIAPGNVLGPFLNNSGSFVLWALTDRSLEGIFQCGPGSCQKVVAVGDPIPGGTWPQHSGPCCITGFNDLGQVALQGLSPRGEILIWSGGTFVRDLGPGYPVFEPVVGTLDGITGFGSADLHPLNRFGAVAFSGRTGESGETAPGVFMLTDATLRKPVSAADPAPTQGSFTSFGRSTVSNEGCIAFEANTTGPSGYLYSLWQTDSQAVTKDKARRFWQDLDDHTRFVRFGRGNDLLHQIYGADLTQAELEARVTHDIFDGFSNSAGEAVRILIFDANGKSVPDADRMALQTDLARIRDLGVIQRLSDLQLALIRRHFKRCDGQIDFGKYRRATEIFANGEIRQPGIENREMDQMHQWVLWFEFAEAAIGAGQDAQNWEKIEQSLLEGLEIYRQVYPALPLPPDAPKADKLYGELERSNASQFDPTRQFTEQQKRTLRDAIDALSPTELRQRLRSRVGEMTEVSQDATPRRVEFVNATADPVEGGFSVTATLQVTDNGIPVTNAVLPLRVRELSITLPPGSFKLATTASSVGGGQYTSAFSTPSIDIGIAISALDDETMAAGFTGLLLNNISP